MDLQENVVLTSVGAEIVKKTYSAVCTVITKKFDCVPSVSGIDEPITSASAHGKAFESEIKYNKLINCLKISVLKDDLTKHNVDAVVNAANEDLNHAGGLAFALSQAGGPDIEKWCNEITKKGKVNTGSAVITKAGKLPCKMIIHAVGPRLLQKYSDKELSEASCLLQQAIQSILGLAEEHQIQSVAIPAISSGIFNFPLDRCAEIIVYTVKHYFEKMKPYSNIMEVRLVNHDDPTVQAMEKACKNIMGPSDPKENRTMHNQGQASTQSVLSSQIVGNLNLHLKKGFIEDEKVDVIVNTTGPDLDLAKGNVSLALLGRAGKQIQNEIHNHRSVKEGDVLKTCGYRLDCKAVLHTICGQLNSSAHGNKVIYSMVQTCLKMAIKEGFQSISFPAIGTGKLQFPKEEVANTMTTAVVNFAKSHKGRKINVYFVIFPKDTKILEAFRRKFNYNGERLQNSNLSSSTKDKSPGFHDSMKYNKAEPSICLNASSVEALRESKLWVKNIIQNPSATVKIQDNHLVHFGVQDHEKLNYLQAKFNVDITLSFNKANWVITIEGNPVDVSCVAVEVENMLCNIYEEIVGIEEKELMHWQNTPEKKSRFERILKDSQSAEWIEKKQTFARCDLTIEKVEKIDNPSQKKLFELNKKRISVLNKPVYQHVNAQFCNLICSSGFQVEYAPPTEQLYGAGIYFATDLNSAAKLWLPGGNEEFVYIIEAELLTGEVAEGKPGLLVPPPINKADPLAYCNSVSNRQKDIYVIFNGQQALPKYLITCLKKKLPHYP